LQACSSLIKEDRQTSGRAKKQAGRELWGISLLGGRKDGELAIAKNLSGVEVSISIRAEGGEPIVAEIRAHRKRKLDENRTRKVESKMTVRFRSPM
jgi:hypothetical protein